MECHAVISHNETDIFPSFCPDFCANVPVIPLLCALRLGLRFGFLSILARQQLAGIGAGIRSLTKLIFLNPNPILNAFRKIVGSFTPPQLLEPST